MARTNISPGLYDRTYGTEQQISTPVQNVLYARSDDTEQQLVIPVQNVLTLIVGKPESGYAIGVTSDRERGRVPKVYAGSSLEQCVKEIMAEIVAAKLES